jgi:predicted nucleic acid-binding protein
VAIVVSDTSPVRALDHLGLLNVLAELFERVYLPPAVEQELLHPRPRFKVVDVGSYSFVEVRPPQDESRVSQYLQTLDPGESEALVLAQEIGADALLIDDAAARAVAVGEGMSVIGTLGILSRAKLRGRIAEAGPLLDRLRAELDFFVSDRLRAEFLRSVGEL